jgi:hypothetical protein
LINRFKTKIMIEARTNPGEATQTNQTPSTITVTMIIEDLDNGIDRTGIQEKYGLEKWEVGQMFQHPSLKGKKAKKKRKLSFNFVDDTLPNPNQTSLVDTADVQIPDVDVHTEASMIVEATPELQGNDEDEFEF